MGEIHERRGAPRILVTGHFGARARATLEVRLIDLSATGARIEHDEMLRPGTRCSLQLPPAVGTAILTARIVRSTVVGSVQMPNGDRQLIYQSGLAFLDVTEKQRATLDDVFKRLILGGDIGS